MADAYWREVTRIQFYRYVERSALATFVICNVLLIYLLGWGNTLGASDLAARAFAVGSAIGFITAQIFAALHPELVPGVFGPIKRSALFIGGALFAGGVIASGSALALNRFLPGEKVGLLLTVSESYKIRGGWSVTLMDVNGRAFELHFVPVPVGTKFLFQVHIGVFGYPNFHSYERVH